jgi:hypothetical protein
VRPFQIAQEKFPVWTDRRAEVADEGTSLTAANELAIRRALDAAGVEFIDENGGGRACVFHKTSKPS